MGGQIGSLWLMLAGGGAGLAPSGYGWALLRMLAALALVCVLAVVLLRWIAQRMGSAPGKGLLRVIERCPLASRQSLWLVEAGGRYFLLGGSDSGITRLAELDPEQLPLSAKPAAAPAARDLFRKVLRRAEELERAAAAPGREPPAAQEERPAAREERS